MKHHQLTIIVITISVLVFFATLQGANTGRTIMDVAVKNSCFSKQQWPDAYTKGRTVLKINGELKEYKDTCMNDATTLKFYCLNGEIKRQRIFCGFNEYCDDGMCIQGKKAEPKKNYPTRDQFIQRYWTESPIPPRN